MSYELPIKPKDRAAGRFIGAVKKALVMAAFEERDRSGVTQQAIANKLGVNRSVINRLLRGDANLTLRSVAEISWALGRKPKLELVEQPAAFGMNTAVQVLPIVGSGLSVSGAVSPPELSIVEALS